MTSEWGAWLKVRIRTRNLDLELIMIQAVGEATVWESWQRQCVQREREKDTGWRPEQDPMETWVWCTLDISLPGCW